MELRLLPEGQKRQQKLKQIDQGLEISFLRILYNFEKRDKYSVSVFKLTLTVILMQVKIVGNYEMKQQLDLGNFRSVLGSCYIAMQKS